MSRASRTLTIALIGSPEERQVALDAIIQPMQSYTPDGKIPPRIADRIIHWRKFFGLTDE